MSEWSESKGYALYQLTNYYGKRFLNLKHLLKERIETTNQSLTLPINWEDVVVFPPPFRGIL